MQEFKIISWSRGSDDGRAVRRPLRDVCNAITTFVGGGIACKGEVLSNTTPYVLVRYGKE